MGTGFLFNAEFMGSHECLTALASCTSVTDGRTDGQTTLWWHLSH